MTKSILLVFSVLTLFFAISPSGHVEAEDQDDDKITISLSKLAEILGQYHEPPPEALEEITRLEKEYPQDYVGKPKYNRSGHQYTTYIVAILANKSLERANKLAFFSQFPDDETRFSATMAFFYLFKPKYRKEIMSVLHSLHGGDEAAVLKRRSDLKNLIASGVEKGTLSDYQIGLIIHAFADSYAHVKVDKDGRLGAFSHGVGHLFHGHKPDIIAYDPERYKDYACQLYQALATSDSCTPRLTELFGMIDRLGVTRDDELPKFKQYAERLEFDEDLYESYGLEWGESVGKEEVRKTIKTIEDHIGQN